MKRRLLTNEIFHSDYLNKVEGNKKIFRDDLDITDKNVYASILAYYFWADDGGFLTQAIHNGGAKMPIENAPVMQTVWDNVYKAALLFFEKYPSSLKVIENCRKNTYCNIDPDLTFEKVLQEVLFGVSLEFGTLLGTFVQAKKNENQHVYPLHKKYNPDAYNFNSFEESFLKQIFQNQDLLVDFMKNTWFGRASLADHYKDIKVIPSEDLWVFNNVVWRQEVKTDRPIICFAGTNRSFNNIEASAFDSRVRVFYNYLLEHSIWNTVKKSRSGDVMGVAMLGGAVFGALASICISRYAPQYLVKFTANSSLANVALNVTCASIISSLAVGSIITGITRHSEQTTR